MLALRLKEPILQCKAATMLKQRVRVAVAGRDWEAVAMNLHNLSQRGITRGDDDIQAATTALNEARANYDQRMRSALLAGDTATLSSELLKGAKFHHKDAIDLWSFCVKAKQAVASMKSARRHGEALDFFWSKTTT